MIREAVALLCTHDITNIALSFHSKLLLLLFFPPQQSHEETQAYEGEWEQRRAS